MFNAYWVLNKHVFKELIEKGEHKGQGIAPKVMPITQLPRGEPAAESGDTSSSYKSLQLHPPRWTFYFPGPCHLPNRADLACLQGFSQHESLGIPQGDAHFPDGTAFSPRAGGADLAATPGSSCKSAQCVPGLSAPPASLSMLHTCWPLSPLPSNTLPASVLVLSLSLPGGPSGCLGSLVLPIEGWKPWLGAQALPASSFISFPLCHLSYWLPSHPMCF